MIAIEKMVDVEFYFLLEDHTWNTDIIKVPESIVFGGTPTENEKMAIDWVYKNIKLHDDVCIVGLYHIGDYSDEQY